MYYGLSVSCGGLIAVMLVCNGALTAQYGVYSATVLIHAVGLLLISAALLLRREGVRPVKGLPLLAYSGGAIGVLTTVFNNLAFGQISVSAILSLGLLAQSVAALLIDQFGLFGMERRAFRARKLLGLLFLGAGVWRMMDSVAAPSFAPVLVSLLSGVTIIVSRMVNARLGESAGVRVSTFYNYAVGLALSLVLLPLLGRSEPMLGGLLPPGSFYSCLGGAFGVTVVLLSNITVTKISSFYMTLLLFLGQVFSGTALDALLTGVFSPRIFQGGLLVAGGLALNLLFDRAESHAPAAAQEN